MPTDKQRENSNAPAIAKLAFGSLLLLLSHFAFAQNAVRGKQLYEAAIVPGYMSCSAPGTCHGPNPATNLNGIRKGTSGAAILDAINKIPLMGPFKTLVTTVDAADMAAYIVNPAAATVPAITASGTALSFGPTQTGTTSSTSMPSTLTLTNSGAGTLSISGIVKGGTGGPDFAATGTCVSATPVALAAGASCTLGATFTPSVAGARAATLTVQSNAASNPTIALSGSGSAVPVPSVALNRNSIAFATQTLGTSSAAQIVALTNTGSAALTITQVATSPNPEFAVTSNCVGNVAAGAGCTLNVSFTPSAAGARSGSLTMTSNASGSPHTLTLTGTAVLTATGIATAARSTVAFPTTVIGTAKPHESTTITNTGNAQLQLTAVTIGGTNAGDFKLGLANTCTAGSNVAPSASCLVDVEFEPQSAGTKTATVTVTHSGPGGATALDVSGTAAGSAFSGSSALVPSNGGAGASSAWQSAVLALLALLAARVRRTNAAGRIPVPAKAAED